MSQGGSHRAHRVQRRTGFAAGALRPPRLGLGVAAAALTTAAVVATYGAFDGTPGPSTGGNGNGPDVPSAGGAQVVATMAPTAELTARPRHREHGAGAKDARRHHEQLASVSSPRHRAVARQAPAASVAAASHRSGSAPTQSTSSRAGSGAGSGSGTSGGSGGRSSRGSGDSGGGSSDRSSTEPRQSTVPAPVRDAQQSVLRRLGDTPVPDPSDLSTPVTEVTRLSKPVL